MALSDDTHAWLDQEGLVTVSDPGYFKIDQFEQSIMELCMDILDMPDKLYSNVVIISLQSFNRHTCNCIHKVHLKTSNQIT